MPQVSKRLVDIDGHGSDLLELVVGHARVVSVLVSLHDLLRQAASSRNVDTLLTSPLADLGSLAVSSPCPSRVTSETNTTRAIQPLLHVLAEVLSVIVREVDLVVTPLEGVLDRDVSLAAVDIVNQIDDGFACRSEERRVGKECRSWGLGTYKKDKEWSSVA